MSDDPEDVPQAVVGGATNVAEPSAVKRSRRKAVRDDEERGEFWRGVFGSKTGRREMWGILEAGHAFAERFATGPNGFPQPEATWKEAGEQSLAFRLYLSWLRLAPDGVALMLAENHPQLVTKTNRG